MGWKTLFHFGEPNLIGNIERLEAVGQARRVLLAYGFDKDWVKETTEHEKRHLFAFPDFEEKSGKRLRLVIQYDTNEGYRLGVVPNRLHTRNDVRKSLNAVDDPSEGDLKYGCFNRFRKR